MGQTLPPSPDNRSPRRFRFGSEEKILVIGLAGVGLLFVFSLLYPSWQVKLKDWVDHWTNTAVNLGYLGGFLSAVIGNLTILSPFPYTVVIFILAALGLNPILLGVLTGVGAEIGELNGYVIGRGGAKWFARQKPTAEQSIRRLIERRPRMLPWLLFIFGLLPLPDDILFIPLGMVKYSFWKLVWPNLIGKVLASLFVTFTGGLAHAAIFSAFTQEPQWWLNLGLAALVLLIFYGFLKIPWERVVDKLAGPDTIQVTSKK